MKEALLYDRLSDNRVRCRLCAHQCLIGADKCGICGVRVNREGKLYTQVYGAVIARHVDPIEKKPLFHFFPGSRAYSIATPGCNFHCRWCQNSDISQMPHHAEVPWQRRVTAQEIVDQAITAACQSIAYTYTEPTIFFEYALDVAQLADGLGTHNVMVSNGYMTAEMLQAFHPYLDAVNVDLKAFRDETYRKQVGGRLQPVLDNLKLMRQLGIWLEVTMLVIPGLNDSPEEFHDAATFIVKELGPQTPWHLSRFHPAYQMTNIPPTPIETLNHAQHIGREAGLHYVYLGNVSEGSHTHCHECGQLLIRRSHGVVVQGHVTPTGRCPHCDTPVAGVGMGGAKAVEA